MPSGVWTTINIPIVDSSSVFQTYEGSSFNTIFSAIGNVQVSISALPASPVNISLDNPTISSSGVPEPTSLALLSMTGVGGLLMRRRRA
ncbi:MAG: PEP-CTERM sorting domain-containing protein [Chthoniobacter sp.]